MSNRIRNKCVTERRARRLAFPGMLAICLIFAGCGDVYRPVANPILQPGGDPQTARIATVVNNNSGGSGSATEVNATGDTNVGNFPVDGGPVHANFYSGTSTRVYVANKASDSVSYFSPLLLGSTVSSISLPSGSAPTFVRSLDGANVYVAESGTNKMGVIDVASGVLGREIPVGVTPVALQETPDTAWVYVANRGSGTVSAYSTAIRAVTVTIPVGTSPVWIEAKADSKTVYVLNQGSGTVSVIDVASNSVVGTLAVGASPRMMSLDARNGRLYVVNTGSNTVSVFNTDTQVPTLLATVTVGAGPAAVTALTNGSRFYVANAGCSDPVAMTGCTGNTVTVVNAQSFAVSKTVTVGSTPIWLDSSPEDTKVVIANRDSDNINNIRTLDDTVVATIASGSPKPVFVIINGK